MMTCNNSAAARVRMHGQEQLYDTYPSEPLRIRQATTPLHRICPPPPHSLFYMWLSLVLTCQQLRGHQQSSSKQHAQLRQVWQQLLIVPASWLHCQGCCMNN
jgi:hypothetical protein